MPAKTIVGLVAHTEQKEKGFFVMLDCPSAMNDPKKKDFNLMFYANKEDIKKLEKCDEQSVVEASFYTVQARVLPPQKDDAGNEIEQNKASIWARGVKIKNIKSIDEVKVEENKTLTEYF